MRSTLSHIREYLRWYFLAFLVLASIILCFVVLHEDRRGIMTVAFLDIGQGDSIFIESPTGTQVLVDGGPGRNLMKAIPKVLPFYDRSVDMIVVTNPDKDHYEGFIGFLRKYSTDVVLEPGTSNPSGTYKALEDEIIQKKIPKIVALKGQEIDLGGGAYLEVVFPDRDVSGLSSNDGSIVMKLVYGKTSVMLQGDSTTKIEEYLVSKGENIQSDILKAGHHGSRTSSSEVYVAAVKPKWTIISSGVDNSYGHPHKETLETMNKFGIETFDTCNNGTIIFKSDGNEFKLKNKNLKTPVVGCK